MSEILNNQVEIVFGKTPNIPSPNVPIQDYDEVVVKHISFDSSVYKDAIFLLWCTYTNSYVASFTIDSNEFKTDQSYETVIKLHRTSPIFGFKLEYYDDLGLNNFTDDAIIVITLQFNKYKK